MNLQTDSASGADKYTRRCAIACVFVAFLFVALVAPQSVRQVRAAEMWTAYTFVPSEAVGSVQGMKKIIAAIEEESGGAVEIRLHLGGSLPIKATNITQALADDVIQFGDDGFFMGNVPIAGLLRLPLLLNTRAEYDIAEEILRPYVEKAFAKQGVVVLGHYLFPLQVPFSRKELRSLKDLKGQKLRVSSPEQAAFVERFGGIPITLGAAEVPPALQRGTIDGVFTASAGGGKIWGDMLKFNYRLGVNYFNVVYAANKNSFDRLAPETQNKIRAAVARLSPKTTDLMDGQEDETTALLAKRGMKIVHPTDGEVAAAVDVIKPYWEEWARDRGPDAVEALGRIRKALGR